MSKVNQQELAEILGVVVMTIYAWQKEGMPYLEREAKGFANEYDTAEVIKWYTLREVKKVSGESAKDRLDRLKGDQVELELKVRLGEVVDVATIQPAIDEYFTDIAGELDGLANQYTDLMHAANDRTDKYQLFRRIAREVRERIGKFEFRSSTDTEEYQEDETEAGN